MGLPAGVDRVVVHEAPATLTPLVAEVRLVRSATGSTGDAMDFDARVTGPDGRVYVELTGYRTSAIPGNLPDTELAPFRAVAPTLASQG